MSVSVSPEQFKSLADCLLDNSGKTPLHERFRALFTLKAVASEQAVEVIASGFADPSALLKHELAYVLGQIGRPSAVPHLEKVLIDADGFQGEMVRHEAAEALGALSSLDSLELLKKYRTDESRSVRETCEIAVAKIEWDHFTEEGRERKQDPNFPTVDPAPAAAAAAAAGALENETITSLRTTLLDESKHLFERYRAMFALRNAVVSAPSADKAREAVLALADGFKDSSALFRHEIAYVFGQLSSPYSIPALLRTMRDPQEDDMVRHEAAEALGGIASEGQPGTFDSPEDEERGVLQILRDWAVKSDAPPVVRESCQVAVDMWEYENSNQFQYADGLTAGAKAGEEGEAGKQRLTGMDRGINVAALSV
ncbi:hypothetical protein QFC24_006352 [Naganishia onofrii]|uniref:Uncharacterized protein n=1 Tax=Naganishia onofrii TaxID=1851511 RepID=A0ACC2X3W5_9TREE|nr:hypothetical protein QFC24_006352 [Naganishia onofrii]